METSGANPVQPAPRPAWLIALIALLVGLVYLHGMYDDYVFDDTTLIQRNESIKTFEGIPTLLGGGSKAPTHRVIRNLSYALDRLVWGDNMRGYHVTNLLLHIFNAVLVLGMSLRVFQGNQRWALAATLLWAVHPVHTDSVTYLSGRRDVLSSFFYLWAFEQYLAWRHGTRGRLALVGCLTSYVFGCFAKELAVTLPGVIVFYEVVLARRREPGGIGVVAREAVTQYTTAPVFYTLLALFPFVFTYYVVKEHPYNIDIGYITPRLPTDFLTLATFGLHYLKLIVFPKDLSIDYFPESLVPSAGIGEPRTLFALVLLAALAVATARAVWRGSTAGFGGAWFVITFLPMSNLVIRSNEPFAEHYLYLPGIGFAWAIVAGFRALAVRRPEWRRGVAVTVTLCVVALMIRTDLRNREWDSPETIYQASLAVFPNSSRLWNNLACFYFAHEQWDEGLAAIERAVALSPRESLYHYNRGFCWRKQGRYADALKEYELAIKEAPAYTDAWIGMAYDLILLKQYKQAVKTYEEILRRMPENPKRWFYHHWMGVAYREDGQFEQARKQFATALELGADHPETLWQRGLVDQAEARTLPAGAPRDKLYASAIEYLLRAIGKFPDSAVLVGALGDLYVEIGKPDKALEAYEGMAAANEEYAADAATRRAKLLRTLGRLDEARKAYTKARELGLKDPELERYWPDPVQGTGRAGSGPAAAP